MVVLTLSLSFLLVKVDDRLDLVLAISRRQDKLMHKPVFTYHNTLLINDVIELTIILFKNFIVVVLLIFVVFQILISTIERPRLSLFLAIVLVVQLLQDVLNLSLELIIALVHQVLEHLWHAQLFGFLSQLLPREDRVQGTVDVGAHLKIVMLDQVVEHLKQ